MRPRDEAKEELIIRTALEIIARAGLSGLKMSALAKQAGLATGTVYVYFQDKDDLIREIYLFLLKKTTTDLALGMPETDPIKVKIRKIAFNYLKEQLEHPEYFAFFEQFFRSPYAHRLAPETEVETAALQPIIDVVLEGQREKIIKEAPAELLVTLVCGMLNELARTALMENRLVTEAEWEVAFSVLWDGVRE